MTHKWNKYFLDLALNCAQMSKDPSTKVGAVVVGPDMEIRATGFNGFPRGIADTDERLNDRETKLKLVVHAECNCICNAVRVGTSLKGCTLFLVASNGEKIWGGPPCSRCTVHVIQAGITKIVTWNHQDVPDRWKDDLDLSLSLLKEADIEYLELFSKKY